MQTAMLFLNLSALSMIVHGLLELAFPVTMQSHLGLHLNSHLSSQEQAQRWQEEELWWEELLWLWL